MNETFAQMILNYSNNSKSSQKLALIMIGLNNLPPEKLSKLKKFEVRWQEFTGGDEAMCVPDVQIEFE